jgi:hypothetical protein
LFSASLDKHWFSPENLKQINIKLFNDAPDTICSGDFSSYAIANRGKGLTESGIENHNVIAAKTRAQIYRCVMEGRNIAKKPRYMGIQVSQQLTI